MWKGCTIMIGIRNLMNIKGKVNKPVVKKMMHNHDSGWCKPHSCM